MPRLSVIKRIKAKKSIRQLCPMTTVTTLHTPAHIQFCRHPRTFSFADKGVRVSRAHRLTTTRRNAMRYACHRKIPTLSGEHKCAVRRSALSLDCQRLGVGRTYIASRHASERDNKGPIPRSQQKSSTRQTSAAKLLLSFVLLDQPFILRLDVFKHRHIILLHFCEHQSVIRG